MCINIAMNTDGVVEAKLHCSLTSAKGKGKGKSVPLHAWSGPQGSRKLTLWRRIFFFNFSTPCIYKVVQI